MNNEQNKINFDELVFRYKWWVGGILLVAIIVSGGYLIWRENSKGNKTVTQDYGLKIAELEDRISNYDSKIKELESKIADQQAGNDNSSVTPNDSGEVAGTTVSSAIGITEPTGKININSATSAELDTLPGIGTAYAARIIEYRASHGGFKSIDEIKNVKGIGDKTFDKMKDKITI